MGTRDAARKRSRKRRGNKAKISKFEIVFIIGFIIFLAVGVTTGFGARGYGTVIIDAGHGGTDPGAIYGGINEKDINLSIAEKTRVSLENAGYKVIMTRDSDEFIGLSERAQIANRYEDAIFISIHCNASENLATAGVETYSARGATEGGELGRVIHNAVLKATGAADRGRHERSFVVLRETKCPAALLEVGFISNEAERAKISDHGYQKKIADGITKAVRKYL